MSATQQMTVSRAMGVSPAQALRGFTHPTLLRDWLCDVSSTAARPGGHIFLGWREGYASAGVYTRLDLPVSLEFTWLGIGDPGPSTVMVTAEPRGEGCQVTLVHSRVGEDPGWQAQAERWQKEWSGALENLQSVLETGVDLRQARRPRLGILMDELSPEKAAALGVPGGKGVLLVGTAEGSGAHRAGLEKEDVLVSLNGVALENTGSFGAALKGLQAGDSPTVEYYRMGEKHRVAIELGHFPVPEYPATAAALSAQVKGMYAETAAALRKLLEGVSDAEASHVPAEGEWSVKELVAHLILTERDYQGWVADMLNDVPVEDWLLMRPNVTPRVHTLAERLGSLEALLAEYEAILDETVCMLAALPESFARERKHLYRRAAWWASEVTPGHYSEEHLEQLKATIAAARS